MAKAVNDKVHDEGLDYIAGGTQIAVCSQQPTTRTEAITTYALATGALAPADFTKAAGDTSGRKITASEQADLSIGTTGTANHVAIVNATELILVTTATAQQLTSGNTVTVPAFKYENRDPS